MSDQQDPAEGADNPQRPEWLPENFQSPEDLAKSYQEAQRKITELSTQNKGLEESIGNLSAQFEQFTAAQNQPDPQAAYGQWQELYEQDPIGTVAQIAAATAQQTLQQYQQQQQAQPGVDPAQYASFVADQTLTAKYGEEWAPGSDLRQKVSEVIQTNPVFNNDAIWLDPAKATQALESAREIVKAQELLSGNDVVQQQLADTRQMKLAAQTAVGASGRPDAPAADKAEWDAIKAAAPKTYYE